MSEVEDIIARAIVDPERWAKFRKNSLLGRWEAKAIVAALSAAGYVIVPREPTEAMLVAGEEAEFPVTNDAPNDSYHILGESPAPIWRAMLEAAK